MSLAVREPALCPPEVRQVHVGRGAPRIQRECFPIAPICLVLRSPLGMERAENDMGMCVAGIAAQGLLQLRVSIVEPSQIDQEAGQVRAGQSRRGMELDGLLVVREGRFPLAPLAECVRTVVMDDRTYEVEPRMAKSLLVRRQGLVQHLDTGGRGHESAAEGVVRPRVLRLEAHGFAALLEGLDEAPDR